MLRLSSVSSLQLSGIHCLPACKISMLWLSSKPSSTLFRQAFLQIYVNVSWEHKLCGYLLLLSLDAHNHVDDCSSICVYYVCKKWCVLPIKLLLCKMVCTVEKQLFINYCWLGDGKRQQRLSWLLACTCLTLLASSHCCSYQTFKFTSSRTQYKNIPYINCVWLCIVFFSFSLSLSLSLRITQDKNIWISSLSLSHSITQDKSITYICSVVNPFSLSLPLSHTHTHKMKAFPPYVQLWISLSLSLTHTVYLKTKSLLKYV